MRYLKPGRLYCFSPPVMLATFLIEIGCAIFILFRYHTTLVSKLAIALLVCLATFQLAEYNICEGAFGVNSLTWARIGYVAITLLPPLGLHLATVLAHEKRPYLVLSAYISAAFFVFVFLFVTQGMRSEQCLGNYVIFSIAPWASMIYALYYYVWLVIGTLYAFSTAKRIKNRDRSTSLKALAVGYLSFIVPTTAVNMINPATLNGIPSIMCGFAVTFAIILTMYVVPRYYRYMKENKTR